MWKALRWRFRIPLTRRRLAVGVVLGALVVVIGTGAIAMHETSTPLFCISCHEMGQPVKTWRLSSHKQVGCEHCHVMPGTVNMFKTKISSLRQIYLHMRGNVPSAIQTHVPDENCKRCHPETRDLVVYHSLKITHKAHWDRDISCTFCHDRVVHGAQAAFKNTPRMETCYKCHDGQKAPNNCSTCHVTLGERRPSTFHPEWVEAHKEDVRQHGEPSCRRCHQEDFCENCHRSASPHPPNWLSLHPKQAGEGEGGCRLCHAVPGEKKGEQMAFCANCHDVRRAHGLRWIGVHAEESRRDPEDCARCHKQDFCLDCHRIYRSHPENWTRKHPAQAKSRPEGCQVCHTQSYCRSCHEKTEPGSHDAQWFRTHGKSMRSGAKGCDLCHRPDFCQTCHRSQAGRPRSHDLRWLKGHGAASLSDLLACQTCHSGSHCRSCHGVDMPHPKGWQQKHPATAKRDAKLCNRCHDQSFCDACHRGSRPPSHRDGWTARHGAQAKARRSSCMQCHTEALCSACHRGVAMPHGQGWRKAHGGEVKSSQARQKCRACHADDYCQRCHGVDLPHPDDWMLTHKDKAGFAKDSICFNCHKWSLCAGCHGEQPGNGR